MRSRSWRPRNSQRPDKTPALAVRILGNVISLGGNFSFAPFVSAMRTRHASATAHFVRVSAARLAHAAPVNALAELFATAKLFDAWMIKRIAFARLTSPAKQTDHNAR